MRSYPPERTPAAPVSDKNAPRAIVWMVCLRCRMPLLPVEMVDGKTVIRLFNLVVSRAEVRCPHCGTVRVFRSQRAPDEEAVDG